ncbi:cryptochrome/photolyase family protein [Paracoccus aestuariivivens]|uniref:Deoxyribodipyrimidine photo-lyase n=1 Tax=Paracoccus aestuariivivens TaxID=1820333 RepID=A0A6L6J7C6_9RHOB|nr:deoxyribodipyrimidine photo-lyase [Paracoccus aestuariivivens]MTH78013.1 deoxyribodipyrimidine photo-lyase [Paracoccus aestuariivivens]
MTPPGIFWLTRDFRFQDNPALAAAIRQGPLLALFFLDRQLMAQGAASRWRLERALKAFDAELRRRTQGQGVLILKGEPDKLLPDLLRETGAREVHQSDWPAPEMRRMQIQVQDALKPLNAALILHPGHLLTHPANIRTGQGGTYRVFTPFARALRAFGPDRPVPPAPQRISPFANPPSGVAIKDIDLAHDMKRGNSVLTRYALPSGETAALDRLEDFLDHAAGYADQRDRPDLDATSGLSEHLAVGEISPRTVWAIASGRIRERPETSDAIAKFLSELIWREFAWHLLIDFPPMAKVPWRDEWASFPWRGPNPDFAQWSRADTGVALVDAGLREMRVTGRMHNRVRMVVASYLTKHFLTDWRLGLAHFQDSLTDWDPAANAMNWQWVAGCGPDASPFFRIFNPEKQAKQFDPHGHYRHRWLAGWTGEPAPEALAYFATLPSGWSVSRNWRERSDLQHGRSRALDAYHRFRGDG